MLSLGPYLLGAAELALLILSAAFTANRTRRHTLPTWTGAPARLTESILAIALVIVVSELLGVLSLLYPGALLALLVLSAALAHLLTRRSRAPNASPAGGAGEGFSPAAPEDESPSPVTGPAAESLSSLGLMALVIAITVFHWATTTKHALNHGIFNFDSLWYHMPFAASMAQSHSVVAIDHVETVFTNWFYPQNSELLHAVGILLTGRDTLSLFLNLGWLAVAFLAAYCVGRPYGRGSVSAIAAAILLECHTLVVRDPGSGKNDLAAAALLLAGIAILVEAWSRHDREDRRAAFVGWPLAAAGLAVGLAAGTRVTVLAMAAVMSLAVLVLAPRGRRWAAAGWWFVPALVGGGYWYLRNLVVAGNPIPEVKSLGPISLPHPERLQEGRPDFSIAHYATDTGVWRHYFAPGLHDAFGGLWPLVIAAAAVAALWALLGGRDRMVRWMGAVALVGLLAYLFTPLSAAGADGEPVGFGINIRYVIPALLGGIVLLPLPRAFDPPGRRWALSAALFVVFLLTDRPDEALHDKARLFALLLVVLAVAVPAAIVLLRRRGASLGIVFGALAALAVVLVAIGYPVQRDYLRERFRNQVASESIPGMSLDAAYRWASGVEGARIGLAGTTAGFAGYGFYGTDLSNHVVFLGEPGPHGAYNAIPTCAGFRGAVNAADLDYLVTSPFLNFIHPGSPISSPEARWLRGSGAVAPIVREGPVTVWKVNGYLDPAGCGPANAPLREIPNTPAG